LFNTTRRITRKDNNKNYSTIGNETSSNGNKNRMKIAKWGHQEGSADIIDDQEQSVSKIANMENFDSTPAQENAKSELLSSVHGSKGL